MKPFIVAFDMDNWTEMWAAGARPSRRNREIRSRGFCACHIDKGDEVLIRDNFTVSSARSTDARMLSSLYSKEDTRRRAHIIA